jgi:hypothetical protein
MARSENSLQTRIVKATPEVCFPEQWRGIWHFIQCLKTRSTFERNFSIDHSFSKFTDFPSKITERVSEFSIKNYRNSHKTQKISFKNFRRNSAHKQMKAKFCI